MDSDKLTLTQLLVPVALTALVLALFLGFQTITLVSDRTTFQQTIAEQDPMLVQLDKVKKQLDALAVGTLKLSQQGDKNAQNIIAQLKKSGINVADQAAQPSGQSHPDMQLPFAPVPTSAPSGSAPPASDKSP